MGRACSTYGGEVHIGFWWRNPREEDCFEDRGVDGRIILKLMFEKWNGSMNWIDLVKNTDR
jgi:hypothetical protein